MHRQVDNPSESTSNLAVIIAVCFVSATLQLLRVCHSLISRQKGQSFCAWSSSIGGNKSVCNVEQYNRHSLYY